MKYGLLYVPYLSRLVCKSVFGVEDGKVYEYFQADDGIGKELTSYSSLEEVEENEVNSVMVWQVIDATHEEAMKKVEDVLVDLSDNDSHEDQLAKDIEEKGFEGDVSLDDEEENNMFV